MDQNQSQPGHEHDASTPDHELQHGSSETAPPPDTQGSAASSTGNTVAAGPSTDRPATAETDEA